MKRDTFLIVALVVLLVLTAWAAGVFGPFPL